VTPADNLERLMTGPEFMRRANTAAVGSVRHVEVRGIKPASRDRKTGWIAGDGDAESLPDGGRTEYRRRCFCDPNINCDQRIKAVKQAPQH
jgi:hypothetical protein